MDHPFSIGRNVSRAWQGLVSQAGTMIVSGLMVGLLSIMSLGICAGPLQLGYTRVCLKVVRGEQATFDDLFSGFQQFLPAFLLALLQGLVLLPWLAGSIGLNIWATVIDEPGMSLGLQLASKVIELVMKLAVAPFMVWIWFSLAAGVPDPLTALRESVTLTGRNFGRVLLLTICGNIIAMLGVFACCIGVLFTAPLLPLIFASAYDNLHQFGPDEVPLPTV